MRLANACYDAINRANKLLNFFDRNLNIYLQLLIHYYSANIMKTNTKEQISRMCFSNE